MYQDSTNGSSLAPGARNLPSQVDLNSTADGGLAYEEEVGFAGEADDTEDVGDIDLPVDPPSTIFSFRTFFKYTGPGWLMSLAYLDPGNLEADLQSGAYTGFQLLWVLFFAHVMGLVLQVLAARLGAVTGKDLAETCRMHYSRNTSYVLWAMTEIAIIGSDVQEVVGSAIAFNLLFGWPLWVGTVITGLDTFTFMIIHYFGSRPLEALIFVLIMTMAGSFTYCFWQAQPPFGEMASGMVPYLEPYALSQAVGTIGAVIMPHNIYLHSSLVKSRRVQRHNEEAKRQAAKYFLWDSAMALTVSFFMNAAILAVFAQGFFNVKCAENNGGSTLTCMPLDGAAPTRNSACELADCSCFTPANVAGMCAPVALQEGSAALGSYLPGGVAKVMFAVGVLASGQSSTMTGTFAGQFVMEGFLGLRVKMWQRTLLTRLVALGPAVLVAFAQSTFPAISSDLGVWLNILQSVQLPFALLPVLHFSSSREIMGNFATTPFWQTVCWLLALLIVGINIGIVFTQFKDMGVGAWVWAALAFAGVVYLTFMALIIRSDIYRLIAACRRCCGQEEREPQLTESLDHALVTVD